MGCHRRVACLHRLALCSAALSPSPAAEQRRAHPFSQWLGWLLASLLLLEAGAAERFTTRRWTVDDGLPQQLVACLAQTQDGYLWCGTWFGLARFDGVRFTVFDRANTPALADEDTVASLASDEAGRLWIGLKRGLAVREGTVIRRPELPPELARARFSALAPARSGGVWAGTSAGLFRLGNGTNQFCGVPPGPAKDTPVNDILGLAELPSGQVVMLIPWGSWIFDPPSGRFSAVGDEINRTQPSRLAGDSRGTIWLGHAGGVDRLKANDTLRLWTSTNSPVDRVTALLARRDGSLWFATGDGQLHRQAEGKIGPVTLDGIPPATVWALLEDAASNLWLGMESGLVRLRPTALQTVTPQNGLPDRSVRSVAPASGGGVWAATDHGIARIKGDLTARRERPPPAIWTTVLEDHRGRVWLGRKYSGLEWWDGDPWRPETDEFNLRVLEPHSLFEDADGSLWMGSSSGVGRFADRRWLEWWSPTNGLPRGNVCAIHQDHTGAMWFGVKGGGLVRLKDGQLEIFDRHHGFTDLQPKVIHETDDGALWVGTGNGLHRFVDGRAFAFSTRHGLAENVVNCLLDDGLGNFWISGLRGVHRVPRRELEAVARGDSSHVNCLSLGGADGMENPETRSENQPAGCRTSDGRLWFPTGNGVVVIDPAKVVIDETSPTPLIESVVVDDETLLGDGMARPAGQVRLAPRRAKVLRIAYTAPLLGDGSRVRFRHRLRGLGEQWHETGTERVAYFTNLKPGAYVFEVTAAGPHGDWSMTTATFPFSLAPAFSQTNWFPAGCGALLLLFGGGLATWRFRWQHRALRAEHAAALAEERTRIADDLHDELGGSLTEISVLSELAEKGAAQPEQTAGQIRRIRQSAAELAEAVDEIVWSLNPRHDRTDKFAAYLSGYSQRFLEAAGIGCVWDLPATTTSQPMRAGLRHELLLIVKEALHNVVQHSQASEVRLVLRLTAERLRLEVRDNGRGFDPRAVPDRGNGLASQRRRAARIGGRLTLHSEPGAGTRLEVEAPLDPPDPFINP